MKTYLVIALVVYTIFVVTGTSLCWKVKEKFNPTVDFGSDDLLAIMLNIREFDGQDAASKFVKSWNPSNVIVQKTFSKLELYSFLQRKDDARYHARSQDLGKFMESKGILRQQFQTTTNVPYKK